MAARIPLPLLSLTLLASCAGDLPQARGPIVMGDPATIVTETDSQYLQDALPDFDATRAAAQAETPVATETAKKPDTAETTTAPVAAAAALSSGRGLNVDFGGVAVFFPDLQVRNADRSVKGASSAAYSAETPAIAAKSLVVSGATVKKVQQRLAYSAVLQTSKTPLVLVALGTQSGPWQDLKGAGGSYSIAAQPKLSFSPSPACIRNAVQKAARSARMPRKEEQTLLNSVRNARSVSDAPFALALRASTWRVEGTDAAGKRFMKEIRVDFPL